MLYCIRFPFLSMFINWNEEFSLCSRKESSYWKKLVLVGAKFLITWVDKRCNISNTNIYGIPSSFRKQPLYPCEGRGKVWIYPTLPTHHLWHHTGYFVLRCTILYASTKFFVSSHPCGILVRSRNINTQNEKVRYICVYLSIHVCTYEYVYIILGQILSFVSQDFKISLLMVLKHYWLVLCSGYWQHKIRKYSYRGAKNYYIK